MKSLFRHFFQEKTEHPGVQFFRSLIAGWLAFGIDWLALSLLVYFLPFAPSLMKLLSYPLGVFVAFFVNRHWVFPEGRMFHQKTQVTLYFIGALVGLGISSTALQYFSALWPDFNLGWTNALAMAITWVWNFSFRKFVVFLLPQGGKGGRPKRP
jgi:putative flippase GtrA